MFMKKITIINVYFMLIENKVDATLIHKMVRTLSFHTKFQLL